MTSFWQFIVSLGVVIVLGQLVKPLVKYVKSSSPLDLPSNITNDQWESLKTDNKGGSVLGNLERLLFLGAFWGNMPLLIGMWLAFKVASKWDVWSNVINLPRVDAMDTSDEIERLIFRRQWGLQLLSSFLVGTASNILIAMIGYAAGTQWLGFILC